MPLPPDQLTGFKQLICLGIGRATGELNELVSPAVTWQLLRLTCHSPDEPALQQHCQDETVLATVRLAFQGTGQGSATLAMSAAQAATLLAGLLGNGLHTPASWDALHVGMFSEIGCLVVNGVMSTITAVLRQRFVYTLHPYQEETMTHVCSVPTPAEAPMLLLAQLRCVVEHCASVGHLVMRFPGTMYCDVLAALQHGAWHEGEGL